MPKPRRESMDVTALLRNILDNYPSGSATVREYLQNTDDAGGTIQDFYLDTRTFSSESLIDPALASCQGPAIIIAVNDGYFLVKDWEAITQIHNSSKKSDETSTGKFGLGFRSSYHVTDNPRILSGNLLLILDAHQRVQMFPGGVELPTDGADRKAYKGHFEAFSAILSPKDKRYEGTAIRLPLRLDASQSRIKSTPTDVDAARQMFGDFMLKDLAECMLFLKNITNVRLIEIAQDGSQTILGRAWIDNPDVVGPLRSRNRGREAETSHHKLTVNVEVDGEVITGHWIITHFVEEYTVARKLLEKRLGRKSLQKDMATDKLLPHVAIALPANEPDSNQSQFFGRLFTLLPLPIFTGFPIHINAVLALTSSRQNLRSAADAVQGSREEFLVEWNKVIFSEFVPKAWTTMFKYIVAQPRQIDLFAAWPPFPTSSEGDRMYWKALPARLLEEAGSMAVWPVHVGTKQAPSAHHNLSAVLVASQSSKAPVSSMKPCGTPIITPPSSVYGLIKQSTSYRSRLLTPAAAHPYLKKHAASFSLLDHAAVKAICDYLATGGEVILLYNLPMFTNFKGGYTSLTSRLSFTFATSTEACLFQGAEPDLLDLDAVSPETRDVLLQAPTEKIHVVRVTDVTQYLSRLFGRFQSHAASVTVGVKTEDIAWLVQFWNWVNTWAQASSLLSHTALAVLQQLYIIPLDTPESQPKLRKLARGVMESATLETDVQNALRLLEVPILHPRVSTGRSTKKMVTKHAKVAFILDNIASHTVFDHISQEQRSVLNAFFTSQLSTFQRSEESLSALQQATLRRLPIFPILPSGRRRKASTRRSVQDFGTAAQSSLFVDESAQVIPSIENKSFLDGRDGAVLAEALDHEIDGEMEVLELVLQPANWSQQEFVMGLTDLLIDRLAARLNDFAEDSRRRIAELPIITVGTSHARLKPSAVVDPKSAIACLYEPGDGVLPHGRFAKDGTGTLLQQFRSFGMLRSTLTDFAIVDLVTKISDRSTPFILREKKAILLLSQIDNYSAAKSISSGIQTTLRNHAWLPTNGKMHRPSECWDNRSCDAELCDFVLPIVSHVVHHRNLRDALGWGQVTSNILQAQLVAVVRNKPNHPLNSTNHTAKRVISILRELSRRYRGLSISDGALVELVDAWRIFPGFPFPWTAASSPNKPCSVTSISPGMTDMLKVMGVYERPSSSTLIKELQSISEDVIQARLDDQPETDMIADSVAILHEISRQPSDFDLTQVLVPDDEEELRPINSVIFNDRGYHGAEAPDGSFFALASALMLMIVSADSVLFLDPSQSYLPKQKGGSKRTGVKISLALCRLRYPDQLKPLDGLFGFKTSTQKYKGTLFRLPLRNASQAAQSKLSDKSFTAIDLTSVLKGYSRASTQSLFFSKMKSISALRRAPDGSMSTMWSVEGTRNTRGKQKDGHRLELIITEGGTVRKERWLICTSRHRQKDFPEEVEPLFQQHRLPSPVVAIALNVSSEGSTSRELNSRLFATLPLPISTSLPAHVHGPWILSDDRRSLRYDIADGRGQRPLDTVYNEFILKELLPPLYLHGLAVISSKHPGGMEHCWPELSTDPISSAVSTSLYSQLVTTDEAVFRTISDETIAPKNALIHANAPAAVGKVITALELPEYVNHLPFEADLVKEWDSLRTDTADEVSAVLVDNTTAVKQFYEAESSREADIKTVLRYLLKAEVDIIGVPLLQTRNGRISSFKPSTEAKIFCTDRIEVSELFGPEKVIGPAIGDKMRESLCALDVNVRNMDKTGLREVLGLSPERIVPCPEAVIAAKSQNWYRDLLKLLTSPTSPVKLTDLADLPLILASQGKSAISLERARQADVWWRSPGLDNAIIPILNQLNIRIVHYAGSASSRTHEVDLGGLLTVLGSLGENLKTSCQRIMATAAWTTLADWTKSELSHITVQKLDEAQFHTLIRIPLFPGRQGQSTLPFASASDVYMLPQQVTSGSIARYLPTNAVFAAFSYSLHLIMERLGQNRSMSINAVLGQLNLPNVLPAAENDDLSSVINLICQHHNRPYRSPLVPDENRVLRVPGELYDGSTAVFRQSFHHRPHVFVHPNFHRLMDRLVTLGVHRDVTLEDVVTCSRAIDHDSRAEDEDTRTRAEFLWHFINEDFNDARRLDLDAISNLRFIPSHRQRHPKEPEFSRYGRVLPDVLSMNELCLAEHAQTVWTQRATFAEPPSAITRAVYQELGVPSVRELVDHLVVLATVVAAEHSGNPLLLSDIRHTYRAIHRHAARAKPILFENKDRRIWLNVNDPAKTKWVWRSAAELVFDLRYDQATFFDVKDFLLPYKETLLGAGANEYRYAALELPAQAGITQSSHAEKLLAGWQQLRKRGVLFDIQFQVDGESIKAHRGLLAAVVPHFSLAFTAGFSESQPSSGMDVDDEVPVYPLDPGTSVFAIQSVVDYIYTGKFSAPPSNDTLESKRAIDVLLDLLELAEFWQLDELKVQTMRTMVALQLVRTEACDQILERVQRCNVPELEELCRQTKANNQWNVPK